MHALPGYTAQKQAVILVCSIAPKLYASHAPAIPASAHAGCMHTCSLSTQEQYTASPPAPGRQGVESAVALLLTRAATGSCSAPGVRPPSRRAVAGPGPHRREADAHRQGLSHLPEKTRALRRRKFGSTRAQRREAAKKHTEKNGQ